MERKFPQGPIFTSKEYEFLIVFLFKCCMGILPSRKDFLSSTYIIQAVLSEYHFRKLFD